MQEPSPYLVQRTYRQAEPDTVELSAEAAPEGPALNLRDYWRVVRKHLELIAAVFFGAVFLTGMIVLAMTPYYTAKSLLLIEQSGPQVLNIKDLIAEPPNDNQHDYYQTQYEILAARSLAAQVIKSLELEEHPLFRRGGIFAALWHGVRSVAGAISPRAGSTPRAATLGVSPEIIDAYLSRLSITPRPDTRLVAVEFSTPDPVLSARIVNAHVQTYIRQGMELHAQAGREAQHFLEDKLIDLRERVEKSEAALNAYRRDRGIVTFELHDRGRIMMQNLSDLSKALTTAETARIDLEAQEELIHKGDYASLPAVVSSTLIQNLKGAVAQLSAQYAAMADQFNDDYPPLSELKAKLEDSRKHLDLEVQRMAQSVESSYQAALARERDLEAEVQVEKTRAMALNDASLQDAVLAREVDTNRQLYRSVLERMKEIGVASEVPSSNVSVVDKADPPAYPSSPRRLLDLALAGFLGAFGGIALAFLIEHMDDGLKHPEGVERYLGLPHLGAAPDFMSLGGRAYRPLSYQPRVMPAADSNGAASGTYGREVIVSLSRFSAASEAYRAIRTAILLSRAGEPPRTILIASGTNGEGKTVTAINTAFAFAQVGRRTVLLDADLRRSRCHEVLRVDNHCGLTEVLVGQKKLDEVIHPTAASGLFFMSAGSVPPNPTELLGSDKMRETLAALTAQYDCVLIDAAPIMPVSDTVILSTMVDGVLFVAGPRTPKQMIRSACSRLHHVGAKIFGVVLNQVNLHGPEYYRYGYSYYSYHKNSPAEETASSSDLNQSMG